MPSKTTQKDAMVTARVPIAKRDKGNAVLESIGATQTELVNAAYSYLIENGKLPQTASEAKPADGKRVLSHEQIERIRERRKATTFDVPSSYWEGMNDKEIIRQAIRNRYDSLA